MSWADFASGTGATFGSGSEILNSGRKFIRINFSRVEDEGDKNWVWSPQVVWNPRSRAFEGQVNMHLPDAWGYLRLVEDGEGHDDEQSAALRDPEFPVRLVAMNVFYAQKVFVEDLLAGSPLNSEEGELQRKAAGSLQVLQEKQLVCGEAGFFTGFAVEMEGTEAGGGKFVARVTDEVRGLRATVDENRHLVVERVPADAGGSGSRAASENVYL